MKNKKIIRFFKKSILLLFAVGFSYTGIAQSKADNFEQLLSFSHKHGMFNGCLLIAENGRVIYTGAFGLANKETDEPLNTESAFYLASVSKQLTAMAIMILETQGKLSFEDKLSKFFPEFPDYADKISIDHLLTHTSGIPDYFSLGIYKPDLTNKDVLETLIKQKHLEFEPGEKYSYSNGGYVLLSLIVEQASDEPFHAFLKKNVFEPLGMERSLVFDESKPHIVNRAAGYSGDGKRADYEILTTGDGGIYSTVEDLYKWDRALYSNKLISNKDLQKAFTPRVLTNGRSTNYGYGWMIKSRSQEKTVFHGGSLSGYRTFIERQLESENTIIVLSNGGDSFSDKEILTALRRILWDKPFELPKLDAVVDVEILKTYVSEYVSETHNLDIVIRLADGKLEAQATGQGTFPLRALSDNKFEFKQGNIVIIFDGTTESFVIEQRGTAHNFLKKGASGLGLIRVPRAILQKYVGVYKSPTFPLDLEISVSKEQLMAQATGQGKITLTPESETRFRFVSAGIVINFDSENPQLVISQGGSDSLLIKDENNKHLN